jgi:hypothetical protein
MSEADLRKRALALAKKAKLEERALALAKRTIAEPASETADESPEERLLADIKRTLEEHANLVTDFEVSEMLRVMTEQIEQAKSKFDGLSPCERAARAECKRLGIHTNFGDTPPVPLDVIPEGFESDDVLMSWLQDFRDKLVERATSEDFQAREAHMQQRTADPSQRPRPQPQRSNWLRPRRRGYYWALDD